MRDLSAVTDLELLGLRDASYEPDHTHGICAPNRDVHAEIATRLAGWSPEPTTGMVPTMDPTDLTECRVLPRALSRLPIGSVLRDASCALFTPREAAEATGSFVQYQKDLGGWIEVWNNSTHQAFPARRIGDRGFDVVSLGTPFLLGVFDRFDAGEHSDECPRWDDLAAGCQCPMSRE